MKTKFYIGILVILALIDDFVAFVSPVDFTYHSLSFIPHFTFIALMLIVFSRNVIDRLLMSMLCGLLTDFFFMPSFPTYMILYTIFGLGIGIFQSWMDESDTVKGACILVCVILLELLPYVGNMLLGITRLKVQTWFIYNELLTISLNAVMIMVLIYVFNVFERYEAIQNVRRQSLEKKKYRNLRLTRK